MKILQVSSASSLGGGEVHVGELSRALGASGCQVAIAGRRDGPLRADLALPFANAMDLYSALRLRRFVEAGGFDVVHAHVARDYPIVAAALYGLRRPRLVLTRHLLYPMTSNPLYRRVDGWIATTEGIRRSILPLHPRAVEVIPNWVDLGRFAYRERPWGSPVNVGLLGQVSPHKGHDDAIEAIRELGSACRLLIGGRGEPAYLDALARRAAGLPVRFLGFVKRAEFLDQVDVMILPSWEEPFGIALLEGMAAGVNVIATGAGGPPEILDYGRAGLLVPPRNPHALAASIRALDADPGLRFRLRAAARRRVEERYDIRRVTPQIEAFYRCLTG